MKKSLNKKDYNSLKSLDGPLHQLIKNNHVTTIFIDIKPQRGQNLYFYVFYRIATRKKIFPLSFKFVLFGFY